METRCMFCGTRTGGEEPWFQLELAKRAEVEASTEFTAHINCLCDAISPPARQDLRLDPLPRKTRYRRVKRQPVAKFYDERGIRLLACLVCDVQITGDDSWWEVSFYGQRHFGESHDEPFWFEAHEDCLYDAIETFARQRLHLDPLGPQARG